MLPLTLRFDQVEGTHRDQTDGPVTLWTRDNVGEVLPDMVTPLTWSLLEPLINRSFVAVWRRLHMDDVSAAGLFGRFYGRVYFNRTFFQALMNRFYPSLAGWRETPRLALTALWALLLLCRLPGESEEVIGTILGHRHSEKDLMFWRRLGAETMQVHLAVTVMAELLYQALDKLLIRWGDGTVSAAMLTTGLTGVRSAEAGQALVDLAHQVRHDDSLRALVLAAAPETLPVRLVETDAGRALWAQIERFLIEHGHSAMQEFELAAPRWRDDPTIVLSALQAQVQAVGDEPAGDPTAARLAATAQVECRLNLPKRWFFRHLLRWAQALTVTRENLKYHFVIAHSRLRDLYLALAAQLVAAGRLSSAEDVFFLTDEQVAALVEGKLVPDEGRERVAERRQAWEADRQVVPPLALEQLPNSHLRPVSPSPPPGGDGERLLRGVAASPGSYRGRARVVLSLDDGIDLEPGEVLVVPGTSPGWAPLFVVAGALVTEIGGALSHGAIIAREYGLPAVLNVAAATRRIRTGQLIHVDGSQGVVRLLGEET